ncbi:MAG: DUF308 domain-containing protein [Phycisphaerales bacterium]|nr:DUF308 domain-containing protein [Phycisphaerales bacterium]
MSNHARPANWIILLDGILLLLLGIVLVGTSLQEEAWVVQLGGGLLVLAGLGVGAKLWMTPGHEKVSPVAWIGSLAPLVLGVILLIWPMQALEAFAVTVGIVVILWGLGSCAMALSRKPETGWQLSLTIGIVALGVGIFMLAKPEWAAFLVLVLLGIDLIVRGADRVALGHTIRRATKAATEGHQTPPPTD